MTSRLLLGLLVTALLVVPGTSFAAVRGSPDLDAYVVDKHVVAGEETTLDLVIVNAGTVESGSTTPSRNAEVTTARGLTVSVEDDGVPLSVSTGRQVVGSLPEGATDPIEFEVAVDDAEPGTYEVPVNVRYEYTDYISEADGTRTETDVTRTIEVPIVIQETASFDVVAVDSDARVGSTDMVAVTVENVGKATANDTRVTLAATNADTTFGGDASSVTRYAGSWETGERKTIRVPVTTAQHAVPGGYVFDMTVDSEAPDGTSQQSRTIGVEVRVRPEQTFAVADTESTVSVGESGTYTVTLVNTGPIAVRDATVRLTSQTGVVRFGNASSATHFVGTWGPGENRTVTYEVTTADRAETRRYALSATVAYLDGEGDRGTDRAGSLGVRPAPESTFAYRNLSVALRGSSARVTGRVVNTGDRPVDSALVTAESASSKVGVVDGTHPVGTLAPGESVPFTLGLRVAPNAYPGPRELRLAVQYDRDADRTYTSDATAVRVPIRTDRDYLAVEPLATTLGIDETNAVRVRLENVGDTRLTDVHAHLAVREPYESDGPTAYAASLAPGANATLTFEVTTPEDGVPMSDAIALNVTAETPADRRVRFGPHLVPVTITASDGPMQGVPALSIVGLVVVLLVAAGWWWFN